MQSRCAALCCGAPRHSAGALQTCPYVPFLVGWGWVQPIFSEGKLRMRPWLQQSRFQVAASAFWCPAPGQLPARSPTPC